MDERQLQLARHIVTGLNLEDLKAEDLAADAPLFGSGLGLDSIDALELVVIIERHYQVRISDMEAGRHAFASIAALDAYIHQQRQQPRAVERSA